MIQSRNCFNFWSKKTLAKNPPDQTLAEYQNHKFMKMDFQKRMQSKVESEIKAMNKWHPN